MRARGYAVTDEELEPGLIAVATPIRGYDGALEESLPAWAGTENLEERVDGVGHLDPVVLRELRAR